MDRESLKLLAGSSAVERAENDMKYRLTRAECLEILRASRGASLTKLAERFDVSIDMIKHVRYKCKFILRSEERKIKGD